MRLPPAMWTMSSKPFNVHWYAARVAAPTPSPIRRRQTFRKFVASLASVQGLSIEKLRLIPYWLTPSLGRLMDAVWAITRKAGDPPVSRSMNQHDRSGVQRQ